MSVLTPIKQLTQKVHFSEYIRTHAKMADEPKTAEGSEEVKPTETTESK
jgi:hypothetical protein